MIAIVSGRRERELIAVIDDDLLILEAMAGLLRTWDYEMLTAATDRAALGELVERGRPPDLIVCDYHLSGGVTGVEAIGRLRDAFRIPAFLITGEAAAAELAQTGALQVLRKPADPTILRAMLRQALGDHGRGPWTGNRSNHPTRAARLRPRQGASIVRHGSPLI